MKDFPKIDRSQTYAQHVLKQQCSNCDWEAKNLATEYWRCPSCGADETNLQSSLHFGGLTVREIGTNRFELGYSDEKSSAYVDAGDTPDTILFLLKHNNLGQSSNNASFTNRKKSESVYPNVKTEPKTNDLVADRLSDLISARHFLSIIAVFIAGAYFGISSEHIMVISAIAIIGVAWVDAKLWHKKRFSTINYLRNVLNSFAHKRWWSKIGIVVFIISLIIGLCFPIYNDAIKAVLAIAFFGSLLLALGD